MNLTIARQDSDRPLRTGRAEIRRAIADGEAKPGERPDRAL
jgi:hypothetical protein